MTSTQCARTFFRFLKYFPAVAMKGVEKVIDTTVNAFQISVPSYGLHETEVHFVPLAVLWLSWLRVWVALL